MILSSCSSYLSKANITAIKVVKLLPLYGNEWKVIGYDTNYNYIYYYKDFIIYNSFYLFDSTNKLRIFEGEKRYYYYVHHINDSFGYMYDTYQKQSGVKSSYDSAKHNFLTFDEDLGRYISAKNSQAKLIATNFNKDAKIIEHVYKYEGGGDVHKNDSLSSGLIYLTYFKKLLNFKYSLSKSLDTIPNLKLCKIFVLNNPIYYKDLDKTFDTPNQLIQIDAMDIDSDKEKELLKYFLKHEKIRNQKLKD